MATNRPQTAHEIFAELRTLCDHAGETHFTRIALADRLLKDRTWVASPDGGGGDEGKAIDRLEADCFADLCGVIGLPQLLEIFHHVPDVKEWRKHKFDLKKIWADWKAKQKPKAAKVAPQQRQPQPLPTPADYEEMTPIQARKAYERCYKCAETDNQKIARLEAENAALKEENARLKAEISRFKEGVREALKSA